MKTRIKPNPTATGPPTELRQARIFVVDDEPGVTRLLKINLERTGDYEVATVNDPTLALEQALEFRPDLVLMDVMMPELDGGDLAERFKSVPRLRSVPIVFLTATVRQSEVEANHGLFGGYRFLSKPLALHEIVACIEKELKDR